MKKNLLSILFLAIPILASAYDIEVKNADGIPIYYNYINNGTELEVTSGGYSGEVKIPEKVTYMSRTRKVTSIGDRAFYNCSGLTSVTIPNSVSIINDYAFAYCSGLTSVAIPNSITSIGDGAFLICTGLTSVHITDLEAWCKISFKSSYSSPFIYAEHFYLNGEEIKDLVIPNSVKSIHSYAFHDCRSLTSVTIGNSVSSVGKGAFEGCKSLTSVTIGNSVTFIDANPFRYCDNLTSIKVESGNINYDSRDNCNAIIETKTNTLIAGCMSTRIPNSVTVIGEESFTGCSGLTSVTIPNSVINIGGGAFNGCSGLTSVTIGNSVTSIGEYAFFICSGLTSVTIPNSVTSIGYAAFAFCSGLTTISLGRSLNTIGRSAFNSCSSLTYVTIPNSVTTIGLEAFWECSALTSLIIGKSVTSIGNNAFSRCSGLSSIIVDSENKTFDSRDNCNSIIETGTNTLIVGCMNTDIPNSVTSIGNSAFYGCSTLSSITIPNSVIAIGEKAFYDCSGLITFTIPNSVISIGSYAFAFCKEMKKVYCYAEEVPSTNIDAFKNSNPPNATLYVPIVSLNAYKTTAPWSEFGFILPISGYDYKLTYMVDGGLYSSYTLKEGDEITPEDAPIKEGYTFSGWSDIPETMPASDVTITGTFTVNKYKLTYIVDDVEYKSSEVEFGSAITAEENPTKEGYTFSGWSEIPETMPANDVTITGSFTINKYKLTYTLDGEEYKTAEVDYGTALTPEEAPVKEGYTFSGWSEIPETMPANDVTVTGTFTANKYKLTYMVDGEEYKASEVDYGTAITAEAVPTKEGYTFSGWSEIPSTMPAEDVTVTGTFTVNKYTITYMVDDAVLMTEEVDYGSTIAPPKSQKDGYDILWSFYPTTMPAYSITINGTYTTGISSLNVEEDDRQVFTPGGKRLETPKKGLNIIRMSDGTVKKVVVK